MPAYTPPLGTEHSETNWQQVDQLLSGVAELSRSKLSSDEFWQEVLIRLCEALSAVAARFWTIDGERQASLTKELRIGPDHGSPGSNPAIQHATVLNDVLQTGQAVLAVAADSPSPGPHSNSRWDVLACPVRVDERCVGVLELVRPAADQPHVNEWSLDVLKSVAELCGDYHRERRLEWLDARHVLWQQLGQFALRVHRDLDLHETAYAIANDGRSFIGCDRLSVVAAGTGRGRVLAVSGAANCDPRSDAVQNLENLATAVVARGLPLFFEGSAEGLPPQLRQPLMRYLDSSGSNSLAIIPLAAGSETTTAPVRGCGALVVEQFAGGLDAPLRERLELLRAHCAAALGNAAIVRRIPLSWLFRGRPWQRAAGWWSWTRLALVILPVLVLLGFVVPADFEIEARGELQPRTRREVFSPDDAVVEELKVDHSDRVAAGDVLALLRNPRLELEFKRVGGDLETARKRLGAIQVARIENSGESASRATGAARLSGEEAGLNASIKSLEEQFQLLEKQQDEMTVRSPIAGQVLTWDLPQLLQSRPVQRGQALMTIADPAGPWTLELHVADRRIGHVLDAQQSLTANLPVTYVLATDPSKEHKSTVDRVARSVEPDATDQPAVQVTVAVDQADLTHPRPGAGVTARIYCGRRPIAYVWLHDLIDAVRAWFRF